MCTQVEIAEELSVSPASIALSTKRLEKAGMIIKETDMDNLRCKRLSLTEKGLSVFKAGYTIRDEQDLRLFKDFSPDELDKLNEFLDRLTLNLTKEESNVVDRGLVNDLEKQIEKLRSQNY